MPEAIDESKPDDVMRTADEFIAALQKVRKIEPTVESLCQTYGNDPQSQPSELVAESEQLRQARDAVQEKGRILYRAASQWGADAQSLMPFARGLQAMPSLTGNQYRTLEAMALKIKTLAFQRREVPQSADKPTESIADPVAVAVTMKVKNTRLSVRAAAKAVGIHYLKLQRHPLWQDACNRLKQVGKGQIPRGSKDDGNIEAEDDQE
jgi:hypothetical protein